MLLTIATARSAGSRPWRVDQRAQVGPLDVAHRDVEQPVLLARVADREHVRVLDRGGGARLALEALAEVLVARELRLDQFQGDRDVERQVLGLVDHTHSALTRHPFDPVAGKLCSRLQARSLARKSTEPDGRNTAHAMRLEVKSGPDAGKKAEFEGDRLTIGREPGVELELADDEISRRHAAITRSADGKFTVEDLGSRNGTYVNGKRITEATPLDGRRDDQGRPERDRGGRRGRRPERDQGRGTAPPPPPPPPPSAEPRHTAAPSEAERVADLLDRQQAPRPPRASAASRRSSG